MRFLAIVIMIAFLNNSGNSLFLVQIHPSPWFNEHVKLKPFELPSGVSITLVKNE